ncbi:MAG: hypothetical protein QG597_3775 [Actinomycetota bacterium]|nr:hypothetical protein [Actinomycetota bacterium]
MHAFKRGPSPGCLARYEPLRDLWSRAVQDGCARIVREQLVESQHGYCAYCEVRPSGTRGPNSGWHVDHFRPKSSFPSLAFSWHNLIASCQLSDHCGNFKGDRFDAGLIDPSAENPHDFLALGGSADIIARPELCARCTKRVNVTVEMLGLNRARLLIRRRASMKELLALADSQQNLDACLAVPRDFRTLLANLFHMDDSPTQCPGCGGNST